MAAAQRLDCRGQQSAGRNTGGEVTGVVPTEDGAPLSRSDEKWSLISHITSHIRFHEEI